MFEIEQLVPFFQSYGYLAVFAMLLLCGFGLPLPEDITLVTGGIIVGLGTGKLATMMTVCMIGVLLGDFIMFMWGYTMGDRILRNRLIARLVTPERYAIIQDKIQKNRFWLLFASRFMPGLRAPTFVVAGVSRRVSPWQFLLIDGFAAAISVPVWVYLGYLGADNLDWLMEQIHKGQMGMITLGGLILAIIVIHWAAKRWLAARAIHLTNQENKKQIETQPRTGRAKATAHLDKRQIVTEKAERLRAGS